MLIDVTGYLTAAGLAGGVTFVTNPGLLGQIETSGAALQTLGPLIHQDKILPTAQTVPVATTQTLITGGVAPITNHGAGVAKVTGKKRDVQGGVSFKSENGRGD